MTTALGAVACLVGLLVVAAVAWRRSRLDHADLDERLADLSARPIPAWLADLTDPELPIFAATVADFPGVVFRADPRQFVPRRPDPITPEGIANLRALFTPPCPTCGATGTDGCRTTTGGQARRTHRSRAVADPDGGRAYRTALYDEAGDDDG